jgi:hypothetical protein
MKVFRKERSEEEVKALVSPHREDLHPPAGETNN